MKRQACELNIDVAVEKRGPCGTLGFLYLLVTAFVKSYFILKRLVPHNLKKPSTTSMSTKGHQRIDRT